MTFDAEVAEEADRLLHHRFIPSSDNWFTVQRWVDRWLNGEKYPAFHEHPNPGKLLAAFELLVTTGHLEAGTDEYGARVFRRRS